jgi:hypothetical protein
LAVVIISLEMEASVMEAEKEVTEVTVVTEDTEAAMATRPTPMPIRSTITATESKIVIT